MKPDFGKLPLSFEPNRGQVDKRVNFLSRSRGYAVFLTGEGAVLSFAQAGRKHALTGKKQDAEWWLPKAAPVETPGKPAVLHLQLVGGNRHSASSGLDELPGKTNYLRGRNPAEWRTGIPTYARVKYQDVYPGVDLVYYGNQGKLEYDFVARPGADPSAIRLRFSGGRRMRLDEKTGDLVLQAGQTEVRFHRPLVYQAEGAGRRTVDGRYAIEGRDRVGFSLGSYDHSRPLVIDPSLVFSTYLGGSAMEIGSAIDIDSAGNVYVDGATRSVDFPSTSGAFDTTCGTDGTCNGGAYDAFVTKFNPTGTALIWSTFVGGSGSDMAEGLTLDAANNVYVTGTTASADFPVTPGAYQTTCKNGCSGGDAFVLELNASGSALIYSTYIGGTLFDQGNAITLDAAGDAYIAGYTSSTNYPTTPGAFQTSPKTTPCVFVTELNSTGSQLIYSTFLSGSKATLGFGLYVDSAGEAYVAGQTDAADYPTTPGAFQTTLGGLTGAFLTKLNSTGTALVYSTYLNGSSSKTTPCAACGTDVVVDSQGDAYVSGLTYETNFPVTTGAYQTRYAGGNHDAFIVKLNPSGTAELAATYLGGNLDDGGTALALDNGGNVYIWGSTFSTNFPVTPDAIQSTCPDCTPSVSDSYLSSFDSNLTTLLYSTYLGGSGSEFGHANRNLVVSGGDSPNAYTIGFTSSTDFPTTAGAYQTVSGGSCDAFVVEIGPFGSGGGGGGSVTLTPSSLTFPVELLGAKSPVETATLTNTGSVLVNLTSITITGAASSDFSQTNTCTGSLAVGASCTISVTFRPSAVNLRTATLAVADDASGSPQNVSLSGTGTEVRLNPTSLNFGSVTVGSSSSKPATLTNISRTAALSITSVMISGLNGSDYSQTNTCGSSVAAGASCTITVTFKPSATGTRSGTLGVTDNGGASPQKVSLTGSGQ